jgi:hypothetical protein
MMSEAFIQIVQTARDMGEGMASLLPSWARSISDAPYLLIDHISFALTVTRWRETLDDHEIPPRRIWRDSDALKEWFEHVRADRKREMQGGSSDRSQEIEDPVQNEAARSLLVG